MNDQILGYGVFLQRADGGGLRTEQVSAIFTDPEDGPVQADNALRFCLKKRFDPGVVYLLLELRQLNTRRTRGG